MPEKLNDFIWWLFALTIGGVVWFVRNHFEAQSHLENRIIKLEQAMAAMTITESQTKAILSEQKTDHKEEMLEIKAEFKELRSKLDTILERVVNRKHNERSSDRE